MARHFRRRSYLSPRQRQELREFTLGLACVGLVLFLLSSWSN